MGLLSGVKALAGGIRKTAKKAVSNYKYAKYRRKDQLQTGMQNRVTLLTGAKTKKGTKKLIAKMWRNPLVGPSTKSLSKAAGYLPTKGLRRKARNKFGAAYKSNFGPLLNTKQ